MKNYFFIFLIGIFSILVSNVVTNRTFAYTYDLNESVLFYEEDKELLGENIRKYLENIDDLLIVNSSFEMSDILVENYDFLVYFAMDYIILHYENYQDKLFNGESYSYVNKDLIGKNTNEYISIEEIYDITDKFFGIRDFEIINNDVNVVNNYISLVDYTENLFTLKIEKIEVSNVNGEVMAKVYYENNNCYLYSFENDNQVLKLKNIEVVS